LKYMSIICCVLLISGGKRATWCVFYDQKNKKGIKMRRKAYKSPAYRHIVKYNDIGEDYAQRALLS